eukprot:gene2542-3504_t
MEGTDTTNTQINYLSTLFHEHSYLGKSHITEKKLMQRTIYLFKTALESKFVNTTIIETAFVYFTKILQILNDKICDKKFKCIFVACMYLSLFQSMNEEEYTLIEIYEKLNLYVHYITLEELEKWLTKSLLVLNMDLSVTTEDFKLLQGKTGR